jgi:hypothetical protein
MAIKKQNIGKKMISFEDVRGKIVEVRGRKVILDYAVAELYGVETREINQAVRNNPRKFPKGWMFELDGQESAVLRSKILMLKAESGSGKIRSIITRLSPREGFICWPPFSRESRRRIRQ